MLSSKILYARHALVRTGYLGLEGNRTVVFSQPLFELSKPYEGIQNISDLATELSERTDENGCIVFERNEYDIISDANYYKVDAPKFYTIYNSCGYAQIDVSKFLRTLKETYGIQIERKAITKFYGTVDELCQSLTERINRSIEFKKE